MRTCSFSVTAQSQSGGQKIGNSDVAAGNFKPTNIVGMKTNRLMKFSVDLRPPTHCLLQPSNITDNCSCFPIYMDQDVTTVSYDGCVCQVGFQRPACNYNKKFSYRKQIVRQLRTQYVEVIYSDCVTLKSRLGVTGGHWKQHHSIDHIWLTSNRVVWRLIISWPWSVVTRDHWNWYHSFPISLL